MSIKSIIILTPVYNDWHSFSQLVNEIDTCARDLGDVCIRVLAVDDGSSEAMRSIADFETCKQIQELNVLHLARNLGHQKAIALGLAYINANLTCDAVIVMDADGEDQPRDIVSLLEKHDRFPENVIFAQRVRRSEGLVFRGFYLLYKAFFTALTGSKIAFGNFSLIPYTQLKRVVHLPEIWNHFAAGIMRARIPRSTIPSRRGNRYAGKSSMNFIALVVHGLSAVSVYIEILTVRLIIGALATIGVSMVAFLVLLYVKYLTPLAIPGWATNVAIGIVIILFQAILLLTLLAFLSLNYRSSKLFIPAKDYEDYILDLELIYVN